MPHSSVVSLLPPALLYVLDERAYEFPIPLHVSNRMPTSAHDLGLGSSRSMSVKWSEMMGWAVVGVL